MLLLQKNSPRGRLLDHFSQLRATAGVQAIRVNEMKLIRGNPGDARTVRFPSPVSKPVSTLFSPPAIVS
jgi:hypothetical protein